MDNLGRVRVWVIPRREFVQAAPVDAREMVAVGVGVVVAQDCNTPPIEEKPEPVVEPPKRKRGRPRKAQVVAPEVADVPAPGNDDNATP